MAFALGRPVMVMCVLLNDAFTWATPEEMFLRSRRRRRGGGGGLLAMMSGTFAS